MQKVITFTDFGKEGPYLAQMELALNAAQPGLDVVHLVSDAPVADPRHASYLLAALARTIHLDAVFLCVVDPGVGGLRAPLAIQLGNQWFVGPDNGLLSQVCNGQAFQAYRIDYQPEELSVTFHGRDLFAPIAARLAAGNNADLTPYNERLTGYDWDGDLDEIIYVDHYGNLMSGIRGTMLDRAAQVVVNGQTIAWAECFESAANSRVFWFVNSIGLLEIAVPGGSAAELLCVGVGQELAIR